MRLIRLPSARAAWLHLQGPPRRPQPRALIWVRRVSRRGRGHNARPSSAATRAQYIYATIVGRFTCQGIKFLNTLHSSLSVRCDELHLVLLRSCDYISSCAQRLNVGRNQGHVKVVSGARNASFVHTVTVLTLCVSKTPRNSSNAFSVHPRSSVLVPFGAQSLIAIPASSCAALAPPGCRSISAICPLMPQYRLLFAPHLKECR
jgi:hypothetical protein